MQPSRRKKAEGERSLSKATRFVKNDTKLEQFFVENRLFKKPTTFKSAAIVQVKKDLKKQFSSGRSAPTSGCPNGSRRRSRGRRRGQQPLRSGVPLSLLAGPEASRVRLGAGARPPSRDPEKYLKRLIYFKKFAFAFAS